MYIHVHAQTSGTYILEFQKTLNTFGNKTRDTEYSS